MTDTPDRATRRLNPGNRAQHHLDGHRHGVRVCIAWLHARADQMKDPQAKAILNAAATNLGWDVQRALRAKAGDGE